MTGTLLHAAFRAAASVDQSARTITGLCVPYGPEGMTSYGPTTFTAGSLTWDVTGRVKLLREHDPSTVLGYAVALTETPTGLIGTFYVPPSPEGDTALVEASDGRRDGLSVGVYLDATTVAELVRKWSEGDTSATTAAGTLHEVSQVSIPAFDAARVEGSPAELAASLDGATLLATFSAQDNPTTPTPAQEHNTMTTPETTAPETMPPAAAPPALNAGAATIAVTSEPPIYTFNGSGHSLIRDAFNARTMGDRDAYDRFEQFNAQIRAGETNQLSLLTAAVETRTTAPNFILSPTYRPDMLVQAIDRGRPLCSRLNIITLTDATPFRIPVEASDFYKATTVTDAATTSGSTTVTSATAAFTATDVGLLVSTANLPVGTIITKINSATSVEVSTKATATGTAQSLTVQRSGVQDHTEGQAHATEGDMDVSDVTVTPGAVSGAYRLSRELIDATNPALDAVALRAMLRDYRKVTEGKVSAALAAAAPSPTAASATSIKARLALNAFYDITDEQPDFLFCSTAYFAALAGELDTTNRPMLASVAPTNALGQIAPGWTGAHIDGTELVKSTRLAGGVAYIVNAGDLIVGESATQFFRFEEVEGPGIVKLALWGYFAAKAARNISVQSIST